MIGILVKTPKCQSCSFFSPHIKVPGSGLYSTAMLHANPSLCIKKDSSYREKNRKGCTVATLQNFVISDESQKDLQSVISV